MKFYTFLFSIIAFIAIVVATGWDDLNRNLSSIQDQSSTFGNTVTSGQVTAQTAAQITANANALTKGFDIATQTVSNFQGTITANEIDLITKYLTASASSVETGEKNIVGIAASLKSNNAGDKVGTALASLYASVTKFSSALSAKVSVQKVQDQTAKLIASTKSGAQAFGK